MDNIEPLEYESFSQTWARRRNTVILSLVAGFITGLTFAAPLHWMMANSIRVGVDEVLFAVRSGIFISLGMLIIMLVFIYRRSVVHRWPYGRGANILGAYSLFHAMVTVAYANYVFQI